MKLMLVEPDEFYLSRFVHTLQKTFPYLYDIYSFSNLENARRFLATSVPDLVLADESLGEAAKTLKGNFALAYFVTDSNETSCCGCQAVGKYQNIHLIHKELVGIGADFISNSYVFEPGSNTTSLLAFSGPAGGCGTSTAAAACAMSLSNQGRKVLYLNLEALGDTASHFNKEGNYTMRDLILMLKNKKGNFSMKIHSFVRSGEYGVDFIASPEVAMDMVDLQPADLELLIHELMEMGVYDFVVLDMDFSLEKDWLFAMKEVAGWYWVTDGSSRAAGKINRAYNAFRIGYSQDPQIAPLINKTCLIRNRYQNHSYEAVGSIPVAATLREEPDAPYKAPAIVAQKAFAYLAG